MLFRPTAVVCMLLSVKNLSRYFTGRIANDERLVFFPTIGRHLNETHVEIPVHGWIFEPERRDKRRRAFLAILRKSLHLSEYKDILNRRTHPFLVDNERWKRPRVKLVGSSDELTFKMPRSQKNGHFSDVLVVEKSHLNLGEQDSTIFIEAVAEDKRVFRGTVHLLNDHGLSVISDIDDTIKISNVSSTKSLLRNTFLEEFKVVPGMPQLYSQWAAQHNASFHFVSSSPWQLYEEMQSFCEREGFPDATFHLKSIRPKDKTILNLFKDPLKTKMVQITSILSRFPNRQFVLVGDSGEKDPEVYGQIARNYTQQVQGIFIRQVGTEEQEGRMETAFQDVPREKWTVFADATTVQLPERAR